MENKVDNEQMDEMISDALDYRHQFYNMLDRYNNFKNVLNKTIRESKSKTKNFYQKLEDIYVFEKVYYVKFQECKSYSNQWKTKNNNLHSIRYRRIYH